MQGSSSSILCCPCHCICAVVVLLCFSYNKTQNVPRPQDSPPRGLGGQRGAGRQGLEGGPRPPWLRGMLPACTTTLVSSPKRDPVYRSFCAAQSVVRYVVLQYGRYTKVRRVFLVKKRRSILEQTFCGACDRLRCLQALPRERVIGAALLRRKPRYHEPTDTGG